MTSWANRGVVTYLRLVLHPAMATRTRGLRLLTRGKAPASPPGRLRARVRRRALPVPGRHVLDRVRPSPTTVTMPGTAVVYFHGGAFVHGIARQHWDLVGDLADATGAPVYVPHYGRAPQHTGEEIFALVDAVVEQVTGRDGDGHRDGGDRAVVRIHLAGDSAGGAIALLAAQHLRGDPRLVGVTLISPALDLSQSNPGIAEVEPSDPWLSRAGTAPLMEAWAGDRDLQDPRVSPLFADLSGLPPIHVYSGTRDICWPDVAVLQRRCQEAGTDITVHAAKGSPHVHVLLPTPEGRRDRGVLLAGVTASLRG
ncbi:alpha/beta hydrolase fold domain-containing protein [Ornithinimicrobium pratense]|uniref:Alpha/beta hydrolase n=1 Tax=Ornithinimicrobium pratense TaxID=2593973 RepID=A0A5J6V9P9_9MICO|nr:alpha/beta hydrolase fold domain-containing protein [Ornithinimicrobium pratense]QFG69946.1 alpha/beta hydrolase [Ornithinimicrobium pratense]